jgi:hypothetical protein
MTVATLVYDQAHQPEDQTRLRSLVAKARGSRINQV